MNETLKGVANIGAELGAAMAENARLRGLLREAEPYVMARAVGPMETSYLLQRIRAALSQQTEPLEPAPAQDERDVHQYAFEVGGTENGNYLLMPEEIDEVVRRAREPFEDVLRSLACSLGAGGYNAPTVDPSVFEQKIRWGIDQLTQRIDQLDRPAQTEQQPEQRGLVDAVREAVVYLDSNGLNSIASGSTCHRRMRNALSATPSPAMDAKEE